MAKKKKRKKKKSEKKIIALAVLAAAFIVVLLGLVPVDQLEGLPGLLDDPHGIFGAADGGLLTGWLPEEDSTAAEWIPEGVAPADSVAADSGGLTAISGTTEDESASGQTEPQAETDPQEVPSSPDDTSTADENTGGIGGSPTFDEDAKVIADCPVVRVVDGDTMIITINGVDERVRLIGVDTPESVHPTADKNVPYGEVASAFAKEYLADKTVTVEFDVQERDRYNRILAYIYVDGKMFNETLMEEGHAQIATYPPNVKYVERFQALQDQAQEAKVGMWADDLEDLLWY